jgi:BirA family biotin operon repressor/biotin-[acetyl-CoA-carboxylase] ligase
MGARRVLIPASFNLAAVKAALAGTSFSGHIFHLSSIPSTNDLAIASARAGARTGVWIADEQTSGRGRGSHTWHSAKGKGLYMTALVSPAIPMQSVLRLSLRTAVAVQAGIASVTGFRIRDQIDIRWPNDLLLNGRKCGGILIDTAGRSGSSEHNGALNYAAIGIGINVNHLTFPPTLDNIATSLRRELPGHPVLRREPLAAAILLALTAELDTLASAAPFDPTRYSSWIDGKRVHVEGRPGDPVRSYTGTTAGLDPQGFLRVRTEDGQLHTLLSGGVRELEAVPHQD